MEFDFDKWKTSGMAGNQSYNQGVLDGRVSGFEKACELIKGWAQNEIDNEGVSGGWQYCCLLYTSPSPRD